MAITKCSTLESHLDKTAAAHAYAILTTTNTSFILTSWLVFIHYNISFYQQAVTLFAPPRTIIKIQLIIGDMADYRL